MTDDESKTLKKLKEVEPTLDWYKIGEDGTNLFLAVDLSVNSDEDLRSRVIRVDMDE